MSTITKDLRERVNKIIDDQNFVLKERSEVIQGMWIAAVGQLHHLQLGPGGTAKSLGVRNLAQHIADARYFEVAVDETSDPAQVLGPPDIRAMTEEGKMRRVPTGMLPEAHIAFIDEFFNANGPTLHSMMPPLNERIFHNNGQPSKIPLRVAFMGTNKLNADADQAALWDRVHLRYIVGYLKSRDNLADMVSQAIARMATHGRGVETTVDPIKTKLTIAELDQAHNEALNLDVPDPVWELFFDMKEQLLQGEGIEFSDRRVVDGMTAVLANAWLRGHEEVKTGDLDVLAHMWWTLQDQLPAARSVILGATNPGEKAALDLLDELDKFKGEIKAANDSKLDESRKKRVGIEQVKNADKLIREAQGHLKKAQASGADTKRLEETIGKAEAFKVEVGKAVFGLEANDMANMTGASA